MKKFYTLALTALIGSSAFAQSLRVQNPLKTKEVNPSSVRKAKGALKASAIWENNFDNPSDWIINNDAQNQDDWVIGTGVPSGPYAIAGITSTSGGNFALFDSDLLCSNNQRANLQVAAPINLSSYPAISLQFEEYYRRYQDKTYIEVSNDNGATWVKYEVNKTLGVNQTVGSNPTIVVVDISPTAGGQSAVLFRFRYEGGCDYSWMVDDVKIIETPANNITLNSSWHGDIINDYEYRQVPLSQSHDLVFGAVVSNDGALDQNNVRLNIEVKNTTTGSSVTYTSASVNLPKAEVDTLEYTLPKLTVAGNYQFIMTVVDDSPDATPDNNTITRNFSLTSGDNAVFSQAAPTWGGSFYQPFETTGSTGLYEAIKFISNYKIYNSGDQVYSLGIVMTDLSTPDQELVVELFKYDDPANPDPDALTSVGSVTVTLSANDLSADVASQVTARYFFDSPLPLTKDEIYAIGIETYGGSDAFSIATSGTNNDGGAYLYGNVGSAGAAWYGIGSTPMMHMNLASTVNISETKAAKSQLSSFPNPARDRVTISFNANGGNTTIAINDITGKTVMSKNLPSKNGVNQVVFDNLDLKPGVYYYTVSNNGVSNSNKLVIAR